MDGIMYPISLIIIAIMAFSFNRNNNSFLMIFVLLVGVYIIYSHETGHTATEFKNSMVQSIDESARDFSEQTVK
ncbi:MAG: hypothetical protein AUK54_05660 [Helicobacteraceae bacterium CG2_30_36_10]|nr:MAG: hypothetical protein AUK54_05660 [Helicobacteraceae bacterium CG2_30_36_10]